MKKRKRRYYDSYTAVKSYQHIVRIRKDVVHDWEIDDWVLNNRDSLVNKRKRSRIGFVQTKGDK